MGLIYEGDYGTKPSAATRLVSVNIDGQSIAVHEGTSVMRAAMELGTQIP